MKYLGYFLIALPFAAIFMAGVYLQGFGATVAAFIYGAIYAGVYLVKNDQ